MNSMNNSRTIRRTLYKPIRHFVAGGLALALGLLAGAGNIHAAVLVWTNTAGGYWADPLAWNPNNVPTAADDGTFSAAATYTVMMTNDTILNSIDVRDNQNHPLTLDLQGHTLSLYKSGSSQPTIFCVADPGSATAVVYVVSTTTPGTWYCTNGLAGVRFAVGRSGFGKVIITNLTVVVGVAGVSPGNSTIMGNSSGPPSGTSRGVIVLDGPNTYFTNSGGCNIGNNGFAAQNALIISNSASMTCLSGLVVGSGGCNSNSLLVDSGGRLFSRGSGCNIGNGAGVGNSATVQGTGSLWDLNNQTLPIGSGGVSNSLIVGTGGTVSNISTLAITNGNILSMAGGVLQVSSAVSNSSGTVMGFGTIVGDTTFSGTGTLTPGGITSIGTTLFSNNLTLVSGSTTTMKLDKGQPGSNDFVNVVGTLTENGTLTINNIGAALVGGDTFQLFAAGTESGDFTVTNLPSLSGTLLWNTTQLGPQGVISVVLPSTITGPDNQAVPTNTDVTVSTVVTGVPAPGLQWQLGGTNVADGATGNGSTISGSTSNTLTISNAQVHDSGQYCLIASNVGGAVTNCMTLTVTTNAAAPTINGPTDQYTILGHDAVFSASVAGIPGPTIKWQENGTDIPGATSSSVTITNVQFTQDGNVYSIIAENSEGSATNSAKLHVVVPPTISGQPQNLVITNTQGASFSVTATGVPDPGYQWYFNNGFLTGATNATYAIASATPANAGAYHVVVANVAGSVTSTDATLTVTSTMTASLTPSNGTATVCYDTPLYMTFDRVPVTTGAGKIRIYNVTSSATPVDTIDTGLGNPQPRTIGTENFSTFPIIITGNTVAIYPHLGVLSSNQTYYVTVETTTFAETNGALFAGITDTNAWRFTTKPTGPANPNSVVVAADGSGDFCTVQGAVDFVPNNNVNRVLINIRNGTYTELIDTRNKSTMTFRGQSRTGTIVQYRNNENQNPGTHSRPSFKVYGNDIAIENMTLINTTPQGGGQSEALMIESGAKRFILNNAEVDSRQDTILANVNSSQGYFYNSLVQGNFDYIWGGGNCFFDKCEIRTIPTANNYNLTASRTDNGPTGNWPGYSGLLVSNGLSFVRCRLTRADSSVTSITLAGSNGQLNGLASFIYCSIDTNCYVTPSAGVLASQLLWEYGNSNIDNTASATFGLTMLATNDARFLAASVATNWLNWDPRLALNIISSPTNLTVNSGDPAAFSVSATGVPDPAYQWLKAGTNLVGSTSATLTIASTVADDAGVYSVIVSVGADSVTNSATLTVIPTPFESWQQLHFGCHSCAQAAATADPDGDGQNNMAEFLAGTDPNSSASALRITSAVRQGNDVAISWTTAGGHTNVVQASAGGVNGSYTNNFVDIDGSTTIVSGSGDATTNYVDVAGATNAPSRFYRIRLAP